MDKQSESDVNAVVQQHAEQIATAVGMPLFNPKLSSGGCTDRAGESSDRIFTVQGVYNVNPPQKDQHLASLARIKAGWQAKSYRITDDRTVGPDDGLVAAETPDGYRLEVDRAIPDGLVVLIHSPCYAKP
ncbi:MULTISPECIES: hypothetical protein [unclassified Actinoplanes]|uniref:hypothetical protein n=1 Tax=unclassified Actinoplanes TaxID=2626549 RepID=UPI0003140EBE|nr:MULTISPECIES: hypothetical protein [unclassified Actinoplanes]